MNRWIVTCVSGALCMAGSWQAAAVGQEKTAAGDKPKIADREYVKIGTNLGEFILELNREKAPKTVENFLSYVDDGFYVGTMFHRVISNFMLQGGGMLPDYTSKTTKAPIQNEANNGLKNTKGTIAMARTGAPHSATSQFFINPKDNAFLDYRSPTPRSWGYCVFGKVVGGQDVVEKIRTTPVKMDPRADREKPAAPITPVVMELVERLSDAEAKPFREAARKQAEEEKKRKAAIFQKTLTEATGFLKTKELDVTKAQVSNTGLWHIDTKVGDGASPTAAQRVSVHYTGWLADGREFDSSHKYGKPATFPLRGVIAGWTEGVGGMKVGGTRYLIIPGHLAYKQRGNPRSNPPIPPNATLVFEIELLEIVTPPSPGG